MPIGFLELDRLILENQNSKESSTGKEREALRPQQPCRVVHTLQRLLALEPTEQPTKRIKVYSQTQL